MTRALVAAAGVLLLGASPAAAKPVTLKIASVANATVTHVPAGAAMADAGDVNGDGLSDLVIGGGPAGLRSSSNSAFVVFGHARPFNVDLRSLGRNGIRIDGARLGDAAGAAVAGVGDIDGDGLSDVLVGAPERDDGAGAIYLVRGRRNAGAVDLSDDGAAALRVDGSAGSRLGVSVAGAGDFNGDGLNDLVAGAPFARRAEETGPGAAAGGAWIVLGRRPVGGTVKVSDLADRGVFVEGARAGDLAGASVAGLGDVNGDGRADIAVGAPSASASVWDSNQGIVSTVFGGRGAGVVDLGALGRGGFRIIGDYGGTGTAVAGPGDVNGDGAADVGVTSFTVGADGDYDSGPTAAVVDAAVVFGSASAADVTLADPVPRFVRMFNGRRETLPTVTRVGDLNADGRAELLAGGSDSAAVAAGFLRYGATTPKDGYDVRFTGARDNGYVGVAVTALGDLNGDRRPELVFAGGGSGSRPGVARIVYGFGHPRGACANLRRGGTGDDVITATGVGDRVRSGSGNDSVNGVGGDDCLDGGPGADRLSGGAGKDRLVGAGGRDILIGGDGDDTIDARDGERDTVRCGAGRDVVRADKRDTVRGCELKRV